MGAVNRQGSLNYVCNSKATWSFKLNEVAYLTTNMAHDVVAPVGLKSLSTSALRQVQRHAIVITVWTSIEHMTSS